MERRKRAKKYAVAEAVKEHYDMGALKRAAHTGRTA
jgi:hypothetical protein